MRSAVLGAESPTSRASSLTGRRAFHPRREGTGWWYPQLAGIQPERAPGPLGGVIRWLLQPDPEHRPGDADEVLRSLAVALPAGEEPPWPAWTDSHCVT